MYGDVAHGGIQAVDGFVLGFEPAVPIAGKYRLIDVPISNCINSGINHIAVLTQFNSVSLHRHITQAYTFDDFHDGWVQILAAEQTPRSTDWYQGTADAVRKQLHEIKATRAEYVFVLAGDHLYRMDYDSMVRFHFEMEADISVAVQPIAAQDASRFGLLKRNSDHQIVAFVEKPRDPDVLTQFISRDDPQRPYLGSMGIYLFNTKVLVELLENSSFEDFGGQIMSNPCIAQQSNDQQWKACRKEKPLCDGQDWFAPMGFITVGIVTVAHSGPPAATNECVFAPRGLTLAFSGRATAPV